MPWYPLMAVLTLAIPVSVFEWVPGHYSLRALGLSWFTTIAFLAITQPGLLRRRSLGPADGPSSPRWDGRLFRSLQASLLSLLAVAGLQSGWGDIDLDREVFTTGGAFLLVGTLLLWSSLHSNPFFETRVRHQQEQGQRVVDTGLYGWVRHPGYLAMIFMLTSLPIMLHSLASVLPWAVCVAILVVRLRREESYLETHLDGYKEYRSRVRFRLIPLIW